MTGLSTIILAAVITPSLCQYAFETGIRPDVRFDEENDRFDVTNLIRRQTKHLKPNVDPQSDEFRRKFKPKRKKKHNENKSDEETENDNEVPWPKLLNSESGRSTLRKRIKDKLETHVNDLANKIIYKIRDMRRNVFAYHDNMNSEGGDVEDFKMNLRAFDNDQDFNDGEDEGNIKNEIGEWRRRNRLQDIVNKLHGTSQSRRMMSDPEKEILFHYAFPVDMKVEGFLQAPLE